MKKIFTIILFIFSSLIYAQNKVELRDLSFSVPSEFFYFTELDRQFDFENFHELGKIFTDSTDLSKFPKIQYQYYEIPVANIESSKKVLTSLNEIITKDIEADTLIIKDTENYSLVKFTLRGISVFEIKSLGKKGWLNLQYYDTPQNDTKSFETLETIINSIQHEAPYESEYDKHMKESGEHSKSALIFLAIGLSLFFGSRLIKKL